MTMKMTVKEAEELFGQEVIRKLVNREVEPTSRLIYPAFEPQHMGMMEYMSSSGVPVEGGMLYAYYFQPEDAEDWAFGEMNGIEYGDIDNIEFIAGN